MEWLVEKLATQLTATSHDIFQPETVVLQSKGMEKWLKLEVANLNGVCANLDCPFPKTFITSCLNTVMEEMPEEDLFSRDRLKWRIYKLLKQEIPDDDFELLRHYRGADRSDIKDYQLASNIADLFDRYQNYRPSTILEWSGLNTPSFGDKILKNSIHSQWQRKIWKKVYDDTAEPLFFLERLNRFINMDLFDYREKLPESVNLFGISSLPPLFMLFFQKISEISKVSIYYLTPCREFWEQCVQEKIVLKREFARNSEEFWDIGNPLLSSMGVTGKNFSRLVNSLEGSEELSFFEEREDEGLLAVIQNDMLHLSNRSEFIEDYRFLPKPPFSPSDPSLKIHVCHSSMREVEVLYDQILGMMAEDSTLNPRDFLVMMPDVKTYSPYIKAVFQHPENQKLSLPFSIADRSQIMENPVTEAFCAIIKLSRGRYSASEIFLIFETEAVYRKFGFFNEDIPKIRRIIAESGIRWGIDSEHRRFEVSTKFKENSWQFGIERWLAGYAMPEHSGIVDLEDGAVTPFDITGDEAELAGRFITFIKSLNSVSKTLRNNGDMIADQWESLLSDVIEKFFLETPKFSEDLSMLRQSVDFVTNNIRMCGNDFQAGIDAVISEMETFLADDSDSHGFIQCGITFCRLRPMRSIPARVIALIGMNEGEFPRPLKKNVFDLMASDPLPCDGNNRVDDRYQFLEALISARKRLYISYTGRSIKDNEEIPPSILVSEMADYIFEQFDIPGKDDKEKRDYLNRHLFVHHPLQPFSPSYFDQGNRQLFSFSELNCQGARKILSGPTEEKNLTKNPIKNRKPLQEEPLVNVELSELLSFFRHPARYYIRHVLNINLDTDDKTQLQECEPLEKTETDYFQKLSFISDLLTSSKPEDELLEERYQIFMASGRTPHGQLGKKSFREEFANMARLAGNVKEFLNGAAARSLVIKELKVGNFRLSGTIKNFYPGTGILHYGLSNKPLKYAINCFIEGMALKLSGEDVPGMAVITPNDKIQLSFPENENPENILIEFIEIYHQGINSPVPFFPETSAKYIEKKSLEAARRVWEQNKYSPYSSESTDPYNAAAFPILPLDEPRNPVTIDFIELAQKMYGRIVSYIS